MTLAEKFLSSHEVLDKHDDLDEMLKAAGAVTTHGGDYYATHDAIFVGGSSFNFNHKNEIDNLYTN